MSDFPDIEECSIVRTESVESFYEGEYLEGLEEGYGVLRWSSGSKYEGNFKRGKGHGQGVWTGSDGSSYEGEWVDG